MGQHFQDLSHPKEFLSDIIIETEEKSEKLLNPNAGEYIENLQTIGKENKIRGKDIKADTNSRYK